MAKRKAARVEMIADKDTDRAAPGTVAHVRPSDVPAWEAKGWIAKPTDLQPEAADD